MCIPFLYGHLDACVHPACCEQAAVDVLSSSLNAALTEGIGCPTRSGIAKSFSNLGGFED